MVDRMKNAGGYRDYHSRERKGYIGFIHVGRAGKTGKRIGEMTDIYELSKLPQGSYQMCADESDPRYADLSKNPEYRRVDVQPPR